MSRMRINSLLDGSLGRGSRIVRALAAASLMMLMALPTASFAQTAVTCGPEVKNEVAKVLSANDSLPEEKKAVLYAQLYEQFKYCQQDSVLTPTAFTNAARNCGASVSNLGSVYFEEMSCSGYDPQRRQFASPIKIKQTFGFGGAPLPGSREFVLHCVQDAAGVFQPVGIDSVHLANALGGQTPTWQFAVIAAATHNLHLVQPMSGQSRLVRSILSWALPPTSCNYTPIWGNALNYRIRLDQ